MPLELIIALVFTIPIVAFITAFVWYINLRGAWTMLRKGDKKSSTAASADRLETEEA